MALKIRLSRGGAKKRPFYRIVVADSRSPRDGRFIERLGTYNPMVPKNNDERVVLKEERIKYWLSQGAKPSDRVARFLGQADIVKLPKRNIQTKKHLPRAKTLERLQNNEEAEQSVAKAATSEPSSEDEKVEDTTTGETAVKEVPAEETPVDDAPAEDTLAEEVPAVETLLDDTPAEETAVEEVPVKEATVDDKQAGETPAQEPLTEMPAKNGENDE